MNCPSTSALKTFGSTITRAHKSPNDAAASAFPKIAEDFTAFVEYKAGIGDLPLISLLDLNDDFWAHTLGFVGNTKNPIVFFAEEQSFRRFNPTKGIYEVVRDAAVLGILISNLNCCAASFSPRVQLDSFVPLKSRKRLKCVVERAKDLLCIDKDFFKPKPHLLPLNNGVLNLVENKLIPFNPALPLKDKLPVDFDAEAKCDLFLNSFLRHVLADEDIALLQLYLSQLIDGTNHSQTILILNGQSGWGKSTLIKILTGVFGLNAVGIIRDQIFTSDKELHHYQGKRFLLHPDMPTDFLDRAEASTFKQIVGGDPMWAEGADGQITTIEGSFPCILCCNGKPKIKIDSDADAWMRRLLVVPFGQAQHDLHVGRLAEAIVRTEGPAILNWLLEGKRKLFKAKFQIFKTTEQQQRTVALVMASQSPKAFVKSCLKWEEGAEMSGSDLFTHYHHWCAENQITPFACQYFNQTAKEEIEIQLGLRYRHDLGTQEGTAVRGWKHLTMVKTGA